MGTELEVSRRTEIVLDLIEELGKVKYNLRLAEKDITAAQHGAGHAVSPIGQMVEARDLLLYALNHTDKLIREYRDEFSPADNG